MVAGALKPRTCIAIPFRRGATIESVPHILRSPLVHRTGNRINRRYATTLIFGSVPGLESPGYLQQPLRGRIPGEEIPFQLFQ